MAAPDLNRIKELFNAAMEKPAAKREEFLRGACGDDPSMLRKVLRMMEAGEKQSDFLEKGPLVDAVMPATSEVAPESVGNYRIIQQIGEGGMGIVYLAEQTQPIRRHVALKLIKLGMDTRSVVARFEAERQALAMLNHPSVAHVFDAGATEKGRPYFVMEYIQGEPITKFCDAHQLTVNERLHLFVQVCHAIQHAHQKGIIHRDIKPSNVLVTRDNGEAVPKVIDFGVAKATEQRLTEQTVFTQHGVMIGTPAYMSPEQAELSAIGVDARSDVYSLGVLLYEMVVGVLPFESETLRRAGFAEIQRIIREVEPSKPSTRFRSLRDTSGEICEQRRIDHQAMQRLLSGDLDWITMKAIDKDPARRYASASELAADIQRHLSDEPVLASPPGSAYRLAKFIRRHRGGVAAGVLVFATLVLGIVGMSIGWSRAIEAERVATSQAAEAKRQAEIATAVNEFLNVDLLAAVQPSVKKGKGRDVLMREVLDAAGERIDEAGRAGGRFADKPLVEAGIRDTLGSTYLMLGDLKAAEPHLKRAYQLMTEHARPGDPATIHATISLGQLYLDTGREKEAEKCHRDALDAATRSFGHENPQTLVSKNNLACYYQTVGRPDKAAQLFSEILVTRRRVFGDDKPDTISVASNYASSLVRSNKLDDAESTLREWLPIARRVLPKGDPSIAFFVKNLGEVLARKGRLVEARPLFVEALEIRRRVLGEDHPETITSTQDLAIVTDMEGNYAEAAKLYDAVIRARTRVLGADHPNTLLAVLNLANANMSMKNWDKAENLLTKARATSVDKLGPDHLMSLRFAFLLGYLYKEVGRLDEAESINTKLYESQKRVLGAEHPETLSTLESIAWTQYLRKQYSESEENERNALEVYRRTGGADAPDTRRAINRLATILLADGKPDAARPLLVEWLSLEKKAAGGDKATPQQKIDAAKSLLEVEPVDLRDPKAALGLATEACMATQGKEPELLAVLAESQFQTGDAAGAVATQANAIRLLPKEASQDARNKFDRRLTEFQKAAAP